MRKRIPCATLAMLQFPRELCPVAARSAPGFLRRERRKIARPPSEVFPSPVSLSRLERDWSREFARREHPIQCPPADAENLCGPLSVEKDRKDGHRLNLFCLDHGLLTVASCLQTEAALRARRVPQKISEFAQAWRFEAALGALGRDTERTCERERRRSRDELTGRAERAPRCSHAVSAADRRS